jgi:hypothetical protein
MNRNTQFNTFEDLKENLLLLYNFLQGRKEDRIMCLKSATLDENLTKIFPSHWNLV